VRHDVCAFYADIADSSTFFPGDAVKKKIFSTRLHVLVMVPWLLAFHGVTAVAAEKSVILATTTSTQDSGLLDMLLPVFEKKTGCFVKTVAVGSGQAMAMGRRGEADVLLVHAPDDEETFMREGCGSRRMPVMHNDFVIVGPAENPARISDTHAAQEAFARIAAAGALFLSRGDNSGTHAKERAIWREAGINPEGRRWYQQTGLGMGQTLGIASEKRGYTLADRGTVLALKKNLNLAMLCRGDRSLMNIYHVIEINREKFPKVNATGAKAFADFMISSEAQKIIRSFGVAQFGEPLFFPDAAQE